MSYTIDVTVAARYEEAIDATEDALAAEGFGVLCDVDVTATMEEKLDRGFRRYRILGACTPPLAHEALETEPGLGALLPCNVVVYEDDGEVAVRAVDPVELLGIVDSDELDDVATDVRERFERVLGAVEASFA